MYLAWRRFRSTRNKHPFSFRETNKQEHLKVALLWHHVSPALDCFHFRERKIHKAADFCYKFSKMFTFASAEIIQWIQLELKNNSNHPSMQLLTNKWSSESKINSSFPVKYLSYRSFWLKNDCPRTFHMQLKCRHRTVWIQNMWVTLKPRAFEKWPRESD